MRSREVVDLVTDDDAEVLEAHPVDTLVNGRDQLDVRDRSRVEDLERLREHDQGDRTPVPDVLAVRPRMALEKRALKDVQIPVGDADGEVAERIGRDVDAAGEETVALHRGEGSIVPDDICDRIGRRHPSSSLGSCEMHGRAHGTERRRSSASAPHASLPGRRSTGRAGVAASRCGDETGVKGPSKGAPEGKGSGMLAADISFWTVVWYAFAGLVIGLLARLFAPGHQQMNLLATIALGVVSAILGAFLWNAIFEDQEGVAWI